MGATEGQEPGYMQDPLRFAVPPGERDFRAEVARLRGAYLNRWMDYESFLDVVISEFLEVPKCRRSEMLDGLLPLLSTGMKIQFLQVIVKAVAVDSPAHLFAKRAVEDRNHLAHRPAAMSVRSELLQEGCVPVLVFKRGERTLLQINGKEAFERLDAAMGALMELLELARPDYWERVKEEWRVKDLGVDDVGGAPPRRNDG